jgi:5-methylcytosine-specific restriction protein A
MSKLRMPQATIEKVQARSQGRCERCGTPNSLRWSFHHRIPRGMGGSKDPRLNAPSNIVLLCGSGTEGCHGYVESNRMQSLSEGLLLHRTDDPFESPILLRHGLVMLDDEGGLQSC